MQDIIFNIYQTIGEYFTGRSRRRKLLVSLFLFFVAIFIASIKFEWSVSSGVTQSVFSSLVQSLISLAALLGVMVIFKLQIINNKEERLLSDYTTQQDILYFTSDTKPLSSTEEFILTIKSLTKNEDYKKVGERKIERLSKIGDELEQLEQNKSFIHDFILKFTVYEFAVVMLITILLATNDYIYEKYVGVPSLFLVIILTAYSLFLVVKGSAESLFG